MELFKLERDFYNRDTLVVSKDLIGKYIVRNINKRKLICRITEVEAYCGPEDKGCHSYNNNMTKRNEVMFGPSGYAYVYIIYGMYYCLNVVTEEDGKPCAVLIRSIEPVEGTDYMSFNRFKKRYKDLNSYQRKNFLNGPGKLCMALNITKEQNGLDLCGNTIFIASDGLNKKYKIKSGPRINIDYAEEYKDKPWRFYI